MSTTALGGSLRFDVTVPARADSIGIVRNAMKAFADGWASTARGSSVPPGRFFDEERSSDLALVFTELLTNAILHGDRADESVDAHLSLGPQGIRGSVTDRGAGFDSRRTSAPRVDGGLGLFIVGRLVRSWGVHRTDDTTEVWFEF